MSVFYENTYPIDSRDTDPFNQCRPSALLGILQEAATAAAVELHVSREETLARYNAFWMLARIWYRLSRPLHWDERVRLCTWHRGGKGAAMYRDFDLFVGSEPVGEAVSTWVLADLDTRRLLRLSQVEEFAGTDGGTRKKELLLHRPTPPDQLELAEERLLHYSDCDINGHVNNTRYADFLCDALHLEKLGAGKFVSSLQLGYLRECRAGERLSIRTGDGPERFFVRGDGPEGTARFDGALTLSPLPEKS